MADCQLTKATNGVMSPTTFYDSPFGNIFEKLAPLTPLQKRKIQ